jgi:predicted nuclease of restriction endonuclease-like (RecB) superfamily
MIVQKQNEQGWGKSVVETLASDLQKEYPGQIGYSSRNLWLMVSFYSEYKDDVFLQPMVAEIGWTQNLVIFSNCKGSTERKFYLSATKKYGWTKRVLEHQIDNKTFEKYLLNQTSFDKPLPDKYQNQKILTWRRLQFYRSSIQTCGGG